MHSIKRFLVEDGAATAVEYAVMLALIIVACLGSISAVAGVAREMWFHNSDSISSAFNAGP